MSLSFFLEKGRQGRREGSFSFSFFEIQQTLKASNVFIYLALSCCLPAVIKPSRVSPRPKEKEEGGILAVTPWRAPAFVYICVGMNSESSHSKKCIAFLTSVIPFLSVNIP